MKPCCYALLSFLAFIMSSYITEHVAWVPIIGLFLCSHFPSLFHFSVARKYGEFVIVLCTLG